MRYRCTQKIRRRRSRYTELMKHQMALQFQTPTLDLSLTVAIHDFSSSECSNSTSAKEFKYTHIYSLLCFQI